MEGWLITVMREHLKRRHPATLDTRDASNEAKSKQRKIICYTRNLVCSSTKSIAITELIACVIKDLRPVNLVNGQGFQAGYKLPSATHFTKVIEHKYEETKQKLKDTMQEVEGLSITADLWCSMANDAYLSLTAHFITDEWAMRSICLGTMPVSDRSWIEDKLAEFSIDPVRVVGFVHDSGSNIKLSGQLLHEKYGWASESCAGHDIQLCLKDGLQIAVVDRAIGAARRLVEHLKKSELATTALRKRQQQMSPNATASKPLQIVQDVKTRWNSVYFMIERLLELRWPICAVLSDVNVTKRNDRYLDLKQEQWDLLQELKDILHPLQVATTYLSSEFNVSISSLLPVVHGMIKNLQPKESDSVAIKDFKKLVLQQIRKRWNIDGVDPTNPSASLLATVLDPRFKNVKFLSRAQHSQLEESLAQLIIVPENNTSNDTDCQLSNNNKSALDLLLGDDYSEESRPETNPAIETVRDYLADRIPSRESSPLDWWKMNSHRFILLACLARKYLSIPATSTPSERIFSCAGLIVNRLRSSLNPDHVDMLVFLNKNYDLF